VLERLRALFVACFGESGLAFDMPTERFWLVVIQPSDLISLLVPTVTLGRGAT
jgi:hypothetical protein